MRPHYSSARPLVLIRRRSPAGSAACRPSKSAACRCGIPTVYLGDATPVGVDTTFLPELSADLANLQALLAGVGIQTQIASYGGYRDQATTDLILGFRAADYAAYVTQLAQSAPGKTPLPIDTWRPIAPYGQSEHNYGAAVDLQPIVWPSTETYTQAVMQMQQLAQSVGFRVPLPTTDPLHMELPYTIPQLETMWALLQANLSSQPDATAVDLSNETAAGLVASAIPTTDLQTLLTAAPVATPAALPDTSAPGSLSMGEQIALGLGAAAAVYLVAGLFFRGIND